MAGPPKVMLPLSLYPEILVAAGCARHRRIRDRGLNVPAIVAGCHVQGLLEGAREMSVAGEAAHSIAISINVALLFFIIASAFSRRRKTR